MGFRFDIVATTGSARAGTLHTPHGAISTPVFAPVGTQATVKAVLPRDLKEMGASLILANTYHLHLRPGDELIQSLGGLHQFMAWDGPILTDSGGFQVFSLAELRQITDEGVAFRSHIDGTLYHFTPEYAMQIQHNLGADIIMAFDECAEPDQREVATAAMHRTHAWARRCVEYHYHHGNTEKQALFGIIQGGIFPDLRAESVRYIANLDLPGYAIGGLAVGESRADRLATLDATVPLMPEDRPRYLMGIGHAEDLVEAVRRGVDIFDCVLPTREARHGAALTRYGRLNMGNLRFASDAEPIETGCECYTCTHFSRAYVRHMVKAKEILSHQLLSIHNLYFLLRLIHNLRAAILEGPETFEQYTHDFLQDYRSKESNTELA
ncbi:MAG: tRNA guanosine(34) transglycosylase Tgt [Chloroflexi bacterium]|nr:tRNA guanosine(34) transglycosylase Tgt [Chloroflexota bacterium]